MEMPAIKIALEELGLTETEARVYIAMLELGPESVQNIARTANISRTAAYDIIHSLQEKALASTFLQGKKTFFSAEDPDKLQTYFKNRLTLMQEQFSTFKRHIPELRSLQVKDKPQVRHFQGIAGLEALFRDATILGAKEILEFADADQVYSHVDSKELLLLRSSTAYQKIPIRVLHKGAIRNIRPNTKYRGLKDASPFEGVVWIYEDRVAFVNFSGAIDVVILENPVIAQTMRLLFEQSWRFAEPTRISATQKYA